MVTDLVFNGFHFSHEFRNSNAEVFIISLRLALKQFMLLVEMMTMNQLVLEVK